MLIYKKNCLIVFNIKVLLYWIFLWLFWIAFIVYLQLSDSVDEVNTTLQVFFFGKNGQNKLHYNDFCR